MCALEKALNYKFKLVQFEPKVVFHFFCVSRWQGKSGVSFEMRWLV